MRKYFLHSIFLIMAFILHDNGKAQTIRSLQKKIDSLQEIILDLRKQTAGLIANTSNPCKSNFPSLSYHGTFAGLTSDSKEKLTKVAAILKSSPGCTIVITGYPGGSKTEQFLCSKRIELIKQYLVENVGIISDRLAINCEEGGGDPGTVDIKSN